ncbi:MAG: DUF2029 domain-containing protein [Clostridia bacterium]|nr:DUF2029 domain-containing protein [Clostridia bacterium]
MRNPVTCLSFLILLGALLFFLCCLFVGSTAFLEVFHLGTADLFGDFFHSLYDAARGEAAYTEQGVIYPPLANLICLLLARFLPESYLAGGDPLAWRASHAAMLLLLFFTVFSYLCLAFLLQRILRTSRGGGLLAFALSLSFPMLFLAERGNLLLLALPFLLVFTWWHDAEAPVARECALLCLAVAAALKLYPALFGLVLLAKKRYRAACRAALYAALLFLLPSFAFGGPALLWQMAVNAFRFSSGGQNAAHFMAFFGFSRQTGTLVLCLLYGTALAVTVLASFLPRPSWQHFLLTGAVLLTFSSIFSAYNWLLLLPALLAFVRTEPLRGINWVYFLLMSLPFFLFVPKAWQDNGLIVLLALLITLSLGQALCLACRGVARRIPTNTEE